MSFTTARFVPFLLALAWVPLPAYAEPNKITSGMGHDLAQTMCASCHAIEAGQTNKPDHVGGPAFQSVADRPDVTAAKLREHLLTTHTSAMIPLSMPKPDLSRDELNKIVAYLMSLKTAKTL
jgi:mono/diheme cytochrome c family protein